MRPIIVLAVALAAAASGCLTPAETSGSHHGDDDHHDAGGMPHHAPAAAPSYDATLGDPDVTVEVTGGKPGEFDFDPAVVRAPVDAVVAVVFTNAGEAPHTWTVHGLDVDTGRVAPGASVTVKFRATETGTHEIMCDEPGHYDAGMKGAIEVTAA